MKYKVGDKVRVRRDLVLWKQYCGQSFTDTMSILSGRKVTIGNANEGIYRLVEDRNKYAWTDEMLEDVEEEFKLPEKWCIKLSTKEINDAVNSIELWEGDQLSWDNTGSYTNHYIGFDGNYSRSLVSDGYTEITFDQFKKYVLKESESTPVKDDVKFEVGKWYKYSAEYIHHKTYAKYSSNQSVCGRFYYDEIITENNGFKKGHNWSVLTCKPVLLTDLSEIQQYLPENHPDKIKKRTKKVEDLKYPDTVHCSSKEEHYKVKQFANIGDYEGNCYYLLDAKSWRKEPWTGACASNLESRRTYANYEFSDIIFPGEKVVKEWNVGSYAVLLNNYMGIAKGTVSRIDCDYGHGVTISHTIYNGDPANLSKNSECKWFPTLKEAQVFSDELLGRNKIETKPMLSKEELLAEAKRRYPVGTKYKNAGDYSSNIFVLSSDDWSNSLLDDVVYAEYGKGCLYYKGNWAEIISKPTVEEHSKYVECIGLKEVDVSFWSPCLTVGKIYLVQEDNGSTTFKINGVWCDKSQFKPSTKEAFDKQGKSSVKEKEELVQTEMSQQEACRSCSYYKIVKGASKRCYKQDFCMATGGQHYPKEYIPEKYVSCEYDIIDFGSIGAANVRMPESVQWKMPRHIGISNSEEESPLDSSGDIVVKIIKTEVKQIKL